MLFDINLDEFNNTMITRKDGKKSMTTDTEYWQLRNYLLNRFCRNTIFWNKFKGIRIKNKIELEKRIEKAIRDYVSDEVKNKMKAVVLISGNKATILFIQLSSDIYEKDKLLFDFNITI